MPETNSIRYEGEASFNNAPHLEAVPSEPEVPAEPVRQFEEGDVVAVERSAKTPGGEKYMEYDWIVEYAHPETGKVYVAKHDRSVSKPVAAAELAGMQPVFEPGRTVFAELDGNLLPWTVEQQLPNGMVVIAGPEINGVQRALRVPAARLEQMQQPEFREDNGFADRTLVELVKPEPEPGQEAPKVWKRIGGKEHL